MVSMHRTDSAATKDEKSNIGARLSSGASSLSIIQLRGSKPGDPPIVRTQGVLTVASKRHDASLLAEKGDSFEAREGCTFNLPPGAVDTSVSTTVDTSVVAWSLNPWSFEAGNVASYVVGLTLTRPDDFNSKIQVENVQQGITIFIVRSAPRYELTADNKTDSCVYLDTNTLPKTWSTKGCHVNVNLTTATHVACTCTHLTDFAVELVNSIGSAERVIGQLSGESGGGGSGDVDGAHNTTIGMSLEEKAYANIAVIVLIFGFLLLALTMCGVSTWHYKMSRLQARRLVHQLAKDIQIKQRKTGQRRLSIDGSAKVQVSQVEERILGSRKRTMEYLGGSSTSLEHVIESLRRDFWTDEHLHVLRAAHQSHNTNNLSGRFFHGIVATPPDDSIAIEQIGIWQDFTTRFKERLFIEHEWLSPFRVTVEGTNFLLCWMVVGCCIVRMFCIFCCIFSDCVFLFPFIHSLNRTTFYTQCQDHAVDDSYHGANGS